ncbi:hypothetical protein BH09BAC1_BH09BAC1_29550 [soil metagenome]
MFFSSLLFICAASANASPGEGNSKTLLFLRNHYSAESGFTLLRVKPLNEFGKGDMRLSCRPGMYLGYKYHINLNDHFALRVGTLTGLHSFRYDFDPHVGDSAIYTAVKMSVVKPYLTIPVEMNVRIRFQQRHVIGLVAGISVNLFGAEKLTAVTSLSNNPQGNEIYKLDLVYNRANPFVNFEVGLEYLWVLGSMDMLKFAIKYSAGIRPMFHAQYEHRENDFVLSSGSFNSLNDHLSLGIGYVFTRVNKLVDQAKN